MNSRSAVAAIRRALHEAPALAVGLRTTLILAVLGTAGQLVVPIAVRELLDREVLSGDTIDVGSVVVAGAVAVVALLGAMLANRMAQYRLAIAAARGLAELRVKVFRHVHDLSVLHVQSERRGVLVSRVTSDIEAISMFLEWGGVGMLVGAAQVALVLGLMAVYDWRLTLLVLVAGILYAILLLAFQRILSRAYDRVRVRVADSMGAMSETIAGLPTIRAFGTEDRSRQKVDAALDAQFRTEFRTGALGAAMFSSGELFAASVTAMVVAAGVLVGPDVGLTAGQLVAFLFLVTLFIEPVQLLVEVLDQAQTAAAGVRRVVDVLDTPLELADPGRFGDGRQLPAGPLAVRFTAVRFRYPDGPDVLCDLDVVIAPGERVAVVGETGSGKSTFVKLMTRLVDPVEGTVSLSGIPLEQVRFDSLRRRVAFVPQDGFLFDTTLAENVRYGVPEASRDDIVTAFEELGLTEWVGGLPGGLDARVGERGSRLSAGERQLVALVRAWIVAPDLLVLDEATSAVDPALEVRLRRAIERLTAGRTSVTVAHRLSTAEAADRVLVFDAGRLVQQGTHAELVRQAGVYRELHADWSAVSGS
ncbi:ABC transporter ATP-binding protein [Egicoccus sp. AB-alg6-2]|uniref:ABC transporter ATP-binding protein n=1 Tax=Egicoccus sp. AB-alg6-2 TaxID=3242692 RepID=UPI00359DCC43